MFFCSFGTESVPVSLTRLNIPTTSFDLSHVTSCTWLAFNSQLSAPKPAIESSLVHIADPLSLCIIPVFSHTLTSFCKFYAIMSAQSRSPNRLFFAFCRLGMMLNVSLPTDDLLYCNRKTVFTLILVTLFVLPQSLIFSFSPPHHHLLSASGQPILSTQLFTARLDFFAFCPLGCNLKFRYE